MKNKNIYLAILFLLCFSIPEMLSQTATQNYIHTRTFINDTGNTYLDQIEYFDGLGRPIQSVQKGITPSKEELVSLQQEYNFGRQASVWLPAVVRGNNGSYISYTITIFNASKATNTNKRPMYLEQETNTIYRG